MEQSAEASRCYELGRDGRRGSDIYVYSSEGAQASRDQSTCSGTRTGADIEYADEVTCFARLKSDRIIREVLSKGYHCSILIK